MGPSSSHCFGDILGVVIRKELLDAAELSQRVDAVGVE